MNPVIPDFYEDDGLPNLAALAHAGYPYAGIMAKISQGNYYSSGTTGWLSAFWRSIPCGLLAQGYHGLDIAIDGKLQAEYFLKNYQTVSKMRGDLFVVVDVETGMNDADPDATYSSGQVADCASSFALTIETSLGHPPICYGGSYLRDKRLTVHMLGCLYGWIAFYGKRSQNKADWELAPETYASIGLSLETLFGWQYAGKNGDGTVSGYLPTYPMTTPAGNADLSAVVIASSIDDLKNFTL